MQKSHSILVYITSQILNIILTIVIIIVIILIVILLFYFVLYLPNNFILHNKNLKILKRLVVK